MIEISIKKQKLYYIKDFEIYKEYKISSSSNGVGNERESGKTPIGKHRVCEKIGEGAAIGTVFQERKNTGIISKIYINKEEYPYEEDASCITTRILRLEGLQPSVNKGEGIDSFDRCIYIHGTPYEYAIGKPSSKGCIRMSNENIIELFDFVEDGEEVNIYSTYRENDVLALSKLVEGIDYVYSKNGHRVDPKENDPKYEDILHRAWLEAEAELDSWEWPYFVIETSKLQKKILKERYGIDYRTVFELNPEVQFSFE